MTDTAASVQALQGIANTLTDEVKGRQAQLDAVNLALAQLNAVLTVQLDELETTKAELAIAQETIKQLQAAAADIPADPNP